MTTNQSPNKLSQKVKVLSGSTYVIPQGQTPLGSGSFGVVYRVTDLSRPNYDLAVKIVNKKGKQLDPSSRKEILIVEQLPYCINLVNYERFCIESKNHFYFIMEYCNGGDLYKELNVKKKTFAEAEIIDFLAQFINGYKLLLQKGIVHRDIKPQNILLHNNIYKICDFGLSKQIPVSENSSPMKNRNGEETNLERRLDFLEFSSTPGTPFYQAPDLHTIKEYSAENLDVFSLGVILFQMLFLNQPESKNKGCTYAHPLVDLKGVTDNKAFYMRLKEAAKRSEQGGNEANDGTRPYFNHLDKLIKESSLKRSPEMIELLKSMLEVDPHKRITFDELAVHPLIKSSLDSINNQELEEQRYEESMRNNTSNQLEETKSHIVGLDSTNPVNQILEQSTILNIEAIQEQVIKDSIQICDKMSQNFKQKENGSNSYFTRKRNFYQKLLNQQVKSAQENQQQPEKVAQSSSEQHPQTAEKLLNDQSQQNLPEKNGRLLTLNGIKLSCVLEEIDLQGSYLPLQTSGDNDSSRWSQEIIRISDWRQKRQDRLKQMEDVLLFYQECGRIFEIAAIALSESYSIVKSGGMQKDMINLFDEVCLLSLIQFQIQLNRQINSSNSILQDDFIKQNYDFDEDELNEFNNSSELTLLINGLESDKLRVEQFSQQLQESKESIKKLTPNYPSQLPKPTLDFMFVNKLMQLIQLGVGEYGLLEEVECLTFQRCLLMLALAHSFIKDPIAFFSIFSINKPAEEVKIQMQANEEEGKQKNLKNPTAPVIEQVKLLSRSALLLELEQIKTNEEPQLQLEYYCRQNNINIIANI